MDVKISTSALKSAIAKAMPAVYPTMAPMNCLHLEWVSGSLWVTADNWDRRIEASAGECDGDFSECCVSAKHIETLTASANGEINLTLKDGKLIFQSGGIKASLPTIPAAEFPNGKHDNLVEQSVICSDLAYLIRKVYWAAAKDVQKRVFQTVAVQVDESGIWAAASDKFNTAVGFKTVIAGKFKFLIPDKAAVTLCNAFDANGARLFVSENYVEVRHDSGLFCGRQLDGQFPMSYCQTAVKESGELLGEINREELIHALMPCIALSSEDKHIKARIFCTATKMVIAYSDKNGELYEGEIMGKFPEHKFVVNAVKLLASLQQLEKETVRLEKSGTTLKMAEGEITLFNGLVNDKI